MKGTSFAFVLLLGILLVAGAACGGSGGVSPTPTPTIPAGIIKPDIGYVPQGWQSSESQPGELIGCLFGVDCAAVGCSGSDTVCEDICCVYVYYGAVPSPQQGMYEDIDSLLELATERGSPNISNWQTITISGQTAVYEKSCNPVNDYCFWKAICIKNTTFYEIEATWRENSGNEENIMDVIESITF